MDQATKQPQPKLGANNTYDIVIVGSGLVGTSLCLALAGTASSYGLSIALLDTQSFDTQATAQRGLLDGRATALALGSRNLLNSIDVWQYLSPFAQAIGSIEVSDQGQPWKSDMRADLVQQEALGFVLQNQAMGTVFLDQIRQRCSDFVHLIGEAQVTSIDNARQDSQLSYTRLGKQHTLTTQLVVMADGGRSDLRKRLGMFDTVENYEQVALVANVELDQAHGGLACERFTSSGPLAVLPLTSVGDKHRASLVWTQPLARQEELAKLTDDQVLSEIHEHFGYRMGQLLSIGDRQVYPLALSVANEQARQGLAVIGNAAHTLHPIAGQGFNLALRGNFALAEAVLGACQKGAPIGDLSCLNEFVATTRKDQSRIITTTDKVMKLFSTKKRHYSVLRQLGLFTMEQLPLVKTVFTRAAMGLDIPVSKVLAMPKISDPTFTSEKKL